MRLLKKIAVVAAGVTALTLAATAPAVATKGGSMTYTGTFTSVAYVGSQAECPQPPNAVSTDVAGTWSVTVHGQAASAYFHITDSAGNEHVTFPFPNMKTAYSAGGTVFVAYGETGAGLLTVTLYPTGDFTYVIAPYNNTGLGLPGPTIVCDRVTYYGEQTRS